MKDNQSANARVFVLVDDYEPTELDLHPPKTLYQLTSFINVNSNISVDGGGNGIGGGSCSVTFNDKDFRFFREYPLDKLNGKDFGRSTQPFNENTELKNIILSYPQEVKLFKDLLKEYGKAVPIYETLGNMIEVNNTSVGGKILIPIITSQNAIYIHYLDRDRVFHAGFTGFITRVTVSHNNNQTPRITISGRTGDRLLEYSYMTTGLNNIGNNYRTRYQSLRDEDRAKIALNNRLSGKDASQIIVECFDVANKFFVGKEYKAPDKDGKTKDYRYWKVRQLYAFGDPTGESQVITGTDSTSQTFRIVGSTESGIPVDHASAWKNKSWEYDKPLSIFEDFYPGGDVNLKGSETKPEGDWFQVKISDEFVDTNLLKVKPFQNLLRANLQLFTTDKMTIKDVLTVVKKTTFSLMYFDCDGSFKVERPYFDAYITGTVEETEGAGASNQLLLDKGPNDYDLKYIISKKDRCYVQSSLDENESGLVTRVAISGKADWVTFDKTVEDLTLLGVSESSPKTISKFGDRQVQLDSITLPQFLYSGFKDQILNSYSYAMRLLLSCQKRQVSLVLDQRPDLQVNRKMIFLDYGISFLIRRIAQSFSPGNNRLETTVEGFYVRNMGEGIFNPYFYYLDAFDSGADPKEETPETEYVAQNWELKSWENANIEALTTPDKDTSTSIRETVNNDFDLYELTTEVFENEIQDVIEESPNNLFVGTYNPDNINLLIMVPETPITEKNKINNAYIKFPGEDPKKLTAKASALNKRIQHTKYSKLNEVSYGSYRFTGGKVDEVNYKTDGVDKTKFLYTNQFKYNQLKKTEDNNWELSLENQASSDLQIKFRKQTTPDELEYYKIVLTAERLVQLYDKYTIDTVEDKFESSYPDTSLDTVQIILGGTKSESSTQLLDRIINDLQKAAAPISLDVWIGRYNVKYTQILKDTEPKQTGDQYEGAIDRRFFSWCYALLARKNSKLLSTEITCSIGEKVNLVKFDPSNFPTKFSDDEYGRSITHKGNNNTVTYNGIVLATKTLSGLSDDNWKIFTGGDAVKRKQKQDQLLSDWFKLLQKKITNNQSLINNIKNCYYEIPQVFTSQYELPVKVAPEGKELAKDYPLAFAADKNSVNNSFVTEWGLMALLYFDALDSASRNGDIHVFSECLDYSINGLTMFYDKCFITKTSSGFLLPTTVKVGNIKDITLKANSLIPSSLVRPGRTDLMYHILTIFKSGENQF